MAVHRSNSTSNGGLLADRLSRHSSLIAALLVAAFGALAWSAVAEKSITFDEIAHVTAGFSYWKFGDFRLQPENGVLPQRFATLPLLASGAMFPSRDDPHWHESDVWKLGHSFFYRQGNDFLQMIWRARGMIVLLGMALGIVVFLWSRQLFGDAGGLLSLVIYVFSPTMLAHAALATSDLCVSLLFAVALACFWRGLHRVSLATVSASGLALGLLFVSKMSGVAIVPVAFGLLVIRLVVRRPLKVAWRRRPAVVTRKIAQAAILLTSMSAQAAIALGVIWLCYGCRYSIFGESVAGQDHLFGGETLQTLTRSGGIGTLVQLAGRWHLLPEGYLHGFAYVLQSSQARVSFLNGEFSPVGFRWFFPLAFLLKTPLPTLLLIAAAGFAPLADWWGTREHGRRDSKLANRRLFRLLYRTAPLTVYIAVYWALALRTSLNIGQRHLLPTYPLLFILCGAASAWFHSPRPLVRALPVLAVAWLIVASYNIRPHYLAYFNELAGGPGNGYRHLVDSSLDWGQDLPGLKRWLDAKAAPNELVYLSYFGTGSPAAYGLHARELPSYPDFRSQPETGDLQPGLYCISATNLQCVYIPPQGAWSAEYETNLPGTALGDRADGPAAARRSEIHRQTAGRSGRARQLEWGFGTV